MSSIKRELIERYGKIYTIKQAHELFELGSFCSPFVKVVRRSDGKKGSLRFIRQPLYYFDFKEL